MLDNPQNILCYKVTDFARAVGISRSQTYLEIQAGRLPVIKLNRRTLIRRSDAEAWVERLAVQSQAAGSEG